MRQIFRLTWGWYDSQADYFFYAPEGATPEEFQALCDKLLPEAARQCIQFGGEMPCMRGKREEEYKTWIGWSEIVEELTLILPQHGYDLYEPPRVQYNGSGRNIIRKVDKEAEWEDEREAAQRKLLGAAWDEVCAYNKVIEDEMDRERLSKKVTSSGAAQEQE